MQYYLQYDWDSLTYTVHVIQYKSFGYWQLWKVSPLLQNMRPFVHANTKAENLYWFESNDFRRKFSVIIRIVISPFKADQVIKILDEKFENSKPNLWFQVRRILTLLFSFGL